jgi:hypothetical protein
LDGTRHTVCRTLISDYSKKQDCATRLEIGGHEAAESALQDLGFVVSHPPLSAPVLAQHTLGYLFSARPQDRATYFKALLEVSDLEAFRAQVASLEGELRVADDPILGKLSTVHSIVLAAPFLEVFKTRAPNIGAALDAAVKALIEADGTRVPTASEERLTTLKEVLASKQSSLENAPLGANIAQGIDIFWD